MNKVTYNAQEPDFADLGPNSKYIGSEMQATEQVREPKRKKKKSKKEDKTYPNEGVGQSNVVKEQTQQVQDFY